MSSNAQTARMLATAVTRASNPPRSVTNIKSRKRRFLSINQSQHSCNHGWGGKIAGNSSSSGSSASLNASFHAARPKTRLHRAHLHARKARTAAKSIATTARPAIRQKRPAKSSGHHKGRRLLDQQQRRAQRKAALQKASKARSHAAPPATAAAGTR